jgi:quinol monooxygenase YgiN
LIVFRVDVTVHDDQMERAQAMFANLSEVSRRVPGVIHFDILQDPARPTRFVSIEVYVNQPAVDRQGSLPAVEQVMKALPTLLTDGPHGMIFHVATCEPWPSTADS